MRKKLLWLMLAAGMTIGTAACGSSSSSGNTVAESTEGTTASKEDTQEETTKTEVTEAETEAETEPETETETSKFQTGTWDGMTFTNPWLGISITFPEDSYIFSEEEMESVLGAGQEVLVNNGNFSETQLKLADAITVYDFMVALPDGQSNVQLAYENTNLTTGGKGISPEDYLDVVTGQLVTIEDMGYEIGEKETVQIAGKDFAKVPATLMQGVLYQDYYAVSVGGRMAVMTVSYMPESKAVVDELIAGITAVE